MFTLNYQSLPGKKTVFLLIDQKKFKEVDNNFFIKKCSFPLFFHTKEEIDAWYTSKEKELTWQYLGYLLSLKDYPSFVLKKKLVEKLISTKVQDLALAKCMEKGFVNDQRYLQNKISSLFNKGYGPYYIRHKLFYLGWTQDVDMSSYITIDMQKEKIKEISFLKKDLKKAAKFLERRGFDRKLIFDTLF